MNHSKNTFCFLDDILIVSKGNEHEHKQLVTNVLKKPDNENLELKLKKMCFLSTGSKLARSQNHVRRYNTKNQQNTGSSKIATSEIVKTTKILYG